MRYHNITKDDMLNGDGLRVVLWTAGCNHCCKGCQNPITWDPDGGLLFDDAAKQEVALTIALCEQLLNGRGAVRVHGGGFAGTVQAFVPLDMLEEFRRETERVLGDGCCHVLRIRSTGGVHITE